MIVLTVPGWFPEGDEKEGDETGSSRQRWELSSQLFMEMALEKILSGDGRLQMAGCTCTLPLHPVFPRKRPVCVPSVWAVCAHRAVQPLLMAPAGSRTGPAVGGGCPRLPFPAGKVAPWPRSVRSCLFQTAA